MRIGLAIDALSPELTGIGRYTWQLCQGLGARADIEELSFYRYGRWFSDPSRFLRSKTPPRGPLPPVVLKLMAKKRFGTLLFHSPNYFLPPRCASGIITVHDLSVFRFAETHPAKRVRQFEEGFGHTLARTEHIITDSEFIREELATFAGLSRSKITAVPLGVERHFFQEKTAAGRRDTLARYGLEDERYCLCVATLEPRKGLEFAIDAFADHVRRTGDRSVLAIVGATGWNNADLHGRIAGGVAAGYLKLLNYVPELHLPDLYAGARLFLYPSLYEGFGLPPIEAMAARTPTVVSSLSCLPEVTKGAPKLVDPRDVEGFSAAISEALEDHSWRASAVKAGAQVAAGYDWSSCIAKTVEVYRACSA